MEIGGDLLKRVIRYAGMEAMTRPLYSHRVGMVPANNVTDAINGSCDLLVENESLKDGRIPQVLGLALVVWLVGARALALGVWLVGRCYRYRVVAMGGASPLSWSTGLKIVHNSCFDYWLFYQPGSNLHQGGMAAGSRSR